MPYTDEELAGLSEEERLALEEDDQEQAQEEVEEAPEETQGETPEEAEEAEEAPEEAPEEAEEAPEEAPENTSAVPPEDAEKAEAEASRQVRPEEIPEEFQADYATLDNRLEEGDILLQEYIAEREKLGRKVDNWYAAKQADQAAREQWANDVKAFLSTHPEYEVGSTKYIFLDATVKHLAEQEASLTGAQILAKAHKQVQAELGKYAKLAAPRSPRPTTPNLGDMPAAASNNEGGEFDHIDKLSGPGLEAALAKMDDATYNRYLMR